MNLLAKFVVFDAAARLQGFCGDLLLRGLPSIPSLVRVLLRALHIATRSLQTSKVSIIVAKQDQSLQRFVFWPFGSNGPVRTVQFTTLIFVAVFSSSGVVQTFHYAVKTNAKI